MPGQWPNDKSTPPLSPLLPQVAVACGADAVLTAMLRPAWISACLLNAPDESEAQLTALDLAARPPAKLGVIKCLLACGAIPTARVVQRLLRTCSEDGGAMAVSGSGLAAVRECFLGAMTASEWAVNPLIPGLNLYTAIIAARRQVRRHFEACVAMRCIDRASVIAGGGGAAGAALPKKLTVDYSFPQV